MSVTPILTRALVYGAIVAVAVTAVAAGIGFLVSGQLGLAGALVGGLECKVEAEIAAGRWHRIEIRGGVVLSVILIALAYGSGPGSNRRFSIFQGQILLVFVLRVNRLALRFARLSNHIIVAELHRDCV